MARYLKPTSDLVFKRIFGEHEKIVKSFLNAILPLKNDEKIVSLSYLPTEQIPVLHEFKRPIVDVKCIDEKKRVFIVEMQMAWATDFMQRMLFNTSTAYVKQLPRGQDYHLLQPVYGVALLGDNFENSSAWYHHYKMVNVQDTNQTIEGLQMVFIELQKFQSKKLAERTLQNLWLRFLSELDEHTVDVPSDMLSVTEIQEAVTLAQESAYTQGELDWYEKYWDSVSSEKTLMRSKFDEGKAEAERTIIQSMLKKGMAPEAIADMTGLSIEAIRALG